MSEIGFTFKHLRDDREREIYLLAFWDGVFSGDILVDEMLKQEKEWLDEGHSENKQSSVQQDVATVPGRGKVVRFYRADR
jgi:hypothetical protein